MSLGRVTVWFKHFAIDKDKEWKKECLISDSSI